jgi:DNA-binding transcriptional LysR family regulator
MNPEWGDFRILLALARGGSVAGAARELGVDSSTVSRRLAALEDSIGARLLMRGGREFAWTTEGRAALRAAEAMEQAIAEATRTCRSAILDASGCVRVSMPPAFVPILFAKLMPLVRERSPQLKLELSGDYHRRDLAKGEADVAVRMARPTEPDLIGKRAVEVGWCVYASEGYLAQHGRPKDLEALRQHALVLYKESMHNIEPFRWLEPYRGSDAVRVDNIEVAAQLVLGGSGIGFLPALALHGAPALVRVFPAPLATNSGWVIYHEASRDTARVRAVVQILLEFFEREAELFSGLPRDAD